ncbi:MerR family transcriptional regulator [Hoyosella rhizosphaerae]|uniref:MerR family transcriptional regulator n=1 Tax=Hoyosella rhizosphaerae TaxID=1755582 RepID=A0A916U1W4_9ACTN|nr:MerR family transcriptional regulator [Hoyosella rhizosphaerae]MBN4926810.1 MerR family transcriptional regulator [Hoyosella rhizosphaerae]GGC56286.1 MerR family transcriptional regulator [Hoyosella rhizosphaerae]
MDWSIHEVARLCGVTTRTLRHYDHIGLLTPSRTGVGGTRFYDEQALRVLQRIVMLRALGLGLSSIADVLAGQKDDVAALRHHLVWLEAEQDRLARQVRAVRRTIHAQERGESIMADTMFDGFDHTQYKDEVEQRWGTKAYADGDRWWRSLSKQDKADFMAEVASLNQDWQDAHADKCAPDGERAQALAERHYRWLTSAYQGKAPVRQHLLSLAEMYVADSRFAANYEATPGDGGAVFVRDALIIWADEHLPDGVDGCDVRGSKK